MYKLKQEYTITNVVIGETIVTFNNIYGSKVSMSVKQFNELFEEG